MYREEPDRLAKHFDFIFLDLLCLQAALWLTFYLMDPNWSSFSGSDYRNLAIQLALIHICAAVFGGNYGGILHRGYFLELAAVIRHAAVVMTIVVVCIFFEHDILFLSRRGTVYLAALSVLLLYAERTL